MEMKIIAIAILTFLLTICDLSYAGITDYPQLAKIFLADVKPSVRVRTVKEHKIKLKTNGSAIFNFIGLVHKHNGYKAKEHETTTSDGYRLKIHRIYASPNSPKAVGKPVVYLQHGISGSSDFFVVFGPNQSIAFQLADAGYDVWVGNVRGNTYNKNHEKYGTEDARYWAYSLDEVAAYDVSRSIDYVLEHTQHKSLTFIGYSMGTTLSYMLLSSKPEYNEKINLLISITPIVHFLEPADMLLKVVLNGILWFSTMGLKVLKTKSTYEVLPQSAVFEKFGRESCSGTGFNPCNLMFKMVADIDNLADPEMLSKLVAYLPAGTSYNILKHYSQLLTTNGRFQMYDYDNCGWMDYLCPTSNTTNMAKYNQTTPPEYDLSLVKTPNIIYYSQTDTVAFPKDVEHLKNKLPNATLEEIKGEKSFNHMDFFLHKAARSKVYDHILQMIRKYTKRQ